MPLRQKEELVAWALGGLKPPPEISLSKWSEENIRLPEGHEARPGRLHHWPYMVEILDVIGSKRPEQVTIMKSIRLGFTKSLMFAAGAVAAVDPSPIIILVPTDEDARRTSVEEVEPIFELSPALQGLMRRGRHDGRSTLLRKSLVGGASIKVLSAHAPRKLRAHDAKYLFIDEADGMLITTEGDPISIAIGRTFARADRKIVVGSTPTEEDISVVEQRFNSSDQRVYEVPCPRCGAFNEIMWEQIIIPRDDSGERPDQAYYGCPHCGEGIQERFKAQMVKAGRWRRTKPEVLDHAGFRINALVSLLPNATWPKLAAMFIEAKRGGPALLQPFYNLYMGRTWRVSVRRVDADILRERVEFIGLDDIPDDVVLLTAGADVQDDRIECTVLGWPLHGAPAVLAHAQFDGNTLDDLVWRNFDAFLKQKWKHPNGWRIGIDGVAVDSGGHEGRTQKVYDWTYPRLARNIHAIKGRAGPNKTWARAQKVKGDMRLVLVAVDVIKTEVMDAMAEAPWTPEGDRVHTGMRYSNDLPDEWFTQVTNETRRVKYVKNRATIVFEPKIAGARVEAFDATVYAWAVRQAPAIRSINLKARSEIRRIAPVIGDAPPPKRHSAADFAAMFNS